MPRLGFAYVAIAVALFLCEPIPGNAQGVEHLLPCDTSGAHLAQCAAVWQKVFESGSNMSDMRSAWAAAYYQGFVDGVMMTQAKKTWCPPDAFVPLDQIYALTAKYLQEHPEQWGKPPRDLVNSAVGAAFPCQH